MEQCSILLECEFRSLEGEGYCLQPVQSIFVAKRLGTGSKPVVLEGSIEKIRGMRGIFKNIRGVLGERKVILLYSGNISTSQL